MRAKKAIKNTIWGFAYEAAHIVCAFVLPRLILTSFGSQYNGVTGTISQLVGVIILLQAGIGSVTRASLYKPLAENDLEQVSVIVKTTEVFLRKIAYIYVGLTVAITFIYPFLVIEEFDWLFTASLVLVILVPTFFNCYFGQAYQLLLLSDQQHQFVYIANIVRIIGITTIQVVLINKGFGIQVVYLCTASLLIIEPLIIKHCVKRKYKIISDVEYDYTTINQRWDNFGMEVARFVVSKTSLIVIAVFLNAYEASLFVIYTLILNGVFHLVMPFMKGMSAAFGNMIAKGEHDITKKNMQIYEQIIYTISTFLFTVATIMALPFISLYTINVTDVNYYRPAFLYIMSAAYIFQCYSSLYVGVVNAAGHFKQLRRQSFIEATLCIVFSIVFVNLFGIVGVALGMLLAYSFRTVRYAVYISKNIILRKKALFFKRIILSAACLLFTCSIVTILPINDATNFLLWVLNSIIVSIITLITIVAGELLFYRNDLKETIKKLKSIIRGKSLSMV